MIAHQSTSKHPDSLARRCIQTVLCVTDPECSIEILFSQATLIHSTTSNNTKFNATLVSDVEKFSVRSCSISN